MKMCIASLFGYREFFVPNFVASDADANWRVKFVRYIQSKNMGVISYPMNTVFQQKAWQKSLKAFLRANRFSEFQCICLTRSFLFEGDLHAVIGRVSEGELHITHDPAKENAGKRTEDYEIAEVFVFFRSF